MFTIHQTIYSMKKIFYLLTFSTILFTSCSNDDDNSAITTGSVSSTLIDGSWRITYYWDNDRDETSDYNGYTFTFGNGNVLTALRAATPTVGSWSTINDDGKVKLVILFSTPAELIEISDDWEVTERTNTRIKLKDVSGGSGETDFLTFEKN